MPAEGNAAMDVVSLGSAVLDWLFSAFRDRHRADARVGERHHAEITAGVLVPLRQRVGFLLAILEKRSSPVAVEGEPLPDEEPHLRAVGISPVRYQGVLRPRVPEAQPVQGLLSDPRLAPVDLYFYKCTKDFHLPALIQEFEALAVRMAEFCGRSLRLAEDLQEALTARAPVPVTLLDVPEDGPGLNPALLARHLLNRRLGVEPSPLLANESEGTLKTVDGTEVCPAPGQLDACEALVEEFLQDDEQSACLREEAEALVPEAKDVQERLEETHRMGYLPGRCRYMKPPGWRSWIPWRRGSGRGRGKWR